MDITQAGVIEARHRAWHYWHIDGLPTILQSTGTLLFGLWWLCKDRIHSYWLGLVLLAVAAFIDFTLQSSALRRLKNRVTYPRTGYVARPLPQEQPYFFYKDWRRFLWPALLLGWAIALIVADDWFMVVMTVAAFLVICSDRQEKPPWFAITGVLAFGILFALLPMPALRRAGILFVIAGVFGMIKGSVRLINYLRRHPLPTGESNV